MTEKFACPCCGYKTLDQREEWITCDVCFWEDNGFQNDNPNDAGGPNLVSLRQARLNFEEFGATECRFIPYVRKPTEYEKRDDSWNVT